ncbi:MAG: hypothetical protein WDZ51_05995 [Pirellulaceae bacterium]
MQVKESVKHPGPVASPLPSFQSTVSLCLAIVGTSLFCPAVGLAQFERSRGAQAPAAAEIEAPGVVDTIDWKTGADLTKSLSLPTDVLWEDRTLRDAVQRLAETQGVAIFLDRRIDPDQPLTLALRNKPIIEVIEAIAQELNSGVCRIGDVHYIGPVETAKRLPTVSEIQAEFARGHRAHEVQSLVRSERVEWPMLSTPRDLLRKTADRAGFSWNELENHVPHDLWRDYQLPPMRRSDALTLILAGFNLSYRVLPDTGAGLQLEPIPIPDQVRLTRNHAFGGNLSEAATKIKELFPEVEVRVADRELMVAGLLEHQQEIARLLRGERVRRTVTEPGQRVFSMTQQQVPLGQVIQAIARQLELRVVAGEGLEEELARRVSFSVDKVELPALLDAIIQESELRYELSEDTLTITRK